MLKILKMLLFVSIICGCSKSSRSTGTNEPSGKSLNLIASTGSNDNLHRQIFDYFKLGGQKIKIGLCPAIAGAKDFTPSAVDT